jgi:predicted nucleotidyltransferase
MLSLLVQYQSQLNALCIQYGVRRLELFGSAARADFEPSRSDLDFLVLFERSSKADSADRFLGLLADLENLLNRKVDLIDIRAHRNPYFMAEALKHREVVYAA